MTSTQNNCISLTSDNYDEWAPRMEAYLSKLNIWYTIDKTIERPTVLDARARANRWSLDTYRFRWEEDGANTIRQIIAYCDRARTEEIHSLQSNQPNLTPRNLWDHLKTRYQKRDTAAYVREWSRLIDLRLVDNENLSHEKMKQHADLFNELYDKIKAMDQSIEKVFATLFLISMPKSYNSLIDVLMMQEGLTREMAIRQVLDRSERDSKSDTATVTAMKANARNRFHKRNSAKCSHCQKPGHLESDCWSKHPEKRPQWQESESETAPPKRKRLRTSS